VKHEILPTTLVLVILIVSLSLFYRYSYAQTTSHTTSHIGIKQHSGDRQQGDHHMHKQMLDDNAFSDLSRYTTSSGSRTGDNTSNTG